MILLNPGPVSLSPRVRAALGAEDMCHREPEFSLLTSEVLQRLEGVYDTGGRYAAVMLTGSGTCAVEAMLSTLASSDRPTLVLCNGVYGERMVGMLAKQRKPVQALRSEWTAPLEPTAVRRALDAHPDTAHVAVVHHETTTGRLNDLEGIADECRARGIGLLVDAVSSFGGEDLPFARWQPLAVAATANKCLHGAPGVSFVLARRDALVPGRSQANSLYLDLATYHAEQANGWSPFTQAVHVVRALREALDELAEEGGWQARRRLYLDRSTRVRNRLAGAGIASVIPISACASMLTAFALRESDSYERVHDELKARGYIVYAGQGDLRRCTFRIATMGCIGAAQLDRLLAALTEVFPTARR